MIDGRCFIVGSPRSGTTLLQSLLASHSQVTSFPETHFFYHLIGTYYKRKEIIGVGTAGCPLELQEYLETRGKQRILEERFKSRRYKKAISDFSYVLDQLTLEDGKSIWLEKTPMHLYYIPVIKKYIPTAKFIHIIRDGKDVVASVKMNTEKYALHWGGERSLQSCLDRWLYDIELSESYLEEKDHIFIKYEDLVARPNIIIKKICSFMNLSFEEDMLHKYATEAKTVIAANEPWKTKNTGQITSSNNQLFTSYLKSAEQEYILERIKEIDVSFFR
ncbi:sulfotransferase family protein [Sediminitomix flava]|uniref:Sulfotransferase family protein n=1 Tax=Sediminitomix flava TaxID=379075 RepID=A0A315ZDS2_SEDFL|nr:sulfotransferase [Sediminitomix flava]PWJ43300.1 sulfotransferase family protein [Sediminitomix flava]